MKLIVNRFQGTKTQNNSLWYGGKVAEIITDNEIYTIIANGEVRCEVIAKHNLEINDCEFKKGEVVLSVIDKNNSGKLKYELEGFITNDDELAELIDNTNPDFEINFENNNWLEVFYEDNESAVLDCSNIDEAINEMLEEIKDTIKIENENIIYCRSALQDEFAVRKQEEVCKCCIMDNCEDHSYSLFVDNGFSGLNCYNNPAFAILLKKMNSNSKIYVSDVPRLSRNIINLQEVNKNLQSQNCDIYFVLEKSNLSDYTNKIQNIFLSNNMLERDGGFNQEEMEEIEYE